MRYTVKPYQTEYFAVVDGLAPISTGYCGPGSLFTSRQQADAEAKKRNLIVAAPEVDIFRIAHPDNHDSRIGIPGGPYSVSWEWDAALCVYEKTPTPMGDGLGEQQSHEICGFAAQEDLFSWFGPALESLEKAGFRVFVYTAPAEKVRLGGHQALFDHTAARVKRVEEISAFLRETGMAG